MLINEISIRGFKSFGNNEQILNLNTEKGELILIAGQNGQGKCIEENTTIEVEIDDLELNENLIKFLLEMGEGRKIFLYIKENKKDLYEKIKNFIS